jgi:hypothetical protein
MCFRIEYNSNHDLRCCIFRDGFSVVGIKSGWCRVICSETPFVFLPSVLRLPPLFLGTSSHILGEVSFESPLMPPLFIRYKYLPSDPDMILSNMTLTGRGVSGKTCV